MVKRIINITKSLTTPPSLLSLFFVAFMRTIGSHAFKASSGNIASIIFDIYGGLEWDQITISISEIASWILIMLPPLLGIVQYFSHEMGGHIHLSLYRHKNEYYWWGTQVLGIVFYVFFMCVLYAVITIVICLLSGMSSFVMFMPDSDGFIQASYFLWILPIFAMTLQISFFSLLYATSFLFTRDYRFSTFIYIAPVIIGLYSYSNQEIPSSLNGFINWGIPNRYALFSSFGVNPHTGIRNMIISIFVISFIGVVFARISKPAERKNK